MALQKTYTIPETGIQINYWAAKTATEFDYHSEVCRLWVYGWVSQAARDAGLGYATEKNYYVSVEDFNTYFADSVLQEAGKSPASQAYAYLLDKVPFFADATLI